MLWPANSSWGLNVLFEHTTHTEMNWSWKLLLHHCIKCLWITHPKSSPACSLLFSLCYILLTANCAARKKNYKFALNLPNESYTDNAVTLKLSRAYKFSYFLSTSHSPSVPQSPCFFSLPLQVRILDYIQHLYGSYLIISTFLFSPLCILPVLKHTYKTGPTGMQWIPNTLVFFLGLFLLYLTDCKMLLNSDWAGYISELALTHGFSPTATAKLEPIVIFFP